MKTLKQTQVLSMDFHCSNQTQANRKMIADTNLEFGSDPYLEFECVEDDIFYAELRRQVLLLTADDNEDFSDIKHSNSLSTCIRGSNSLTSNYPTTLQPGSYFNWWEMENTDSVPAWLAKLWKNGHGTGVFIPQIANSRRHKHGMCLAVGDNYICSIVYLLTNAFYAVCRKNEQQAETSIQASGEKLVSVHIDKKIMYLLLSNLRCAKQQNSWVYYTAKLNLSRPYFSYWFLVRCNLRRIRRCTLTSYICKVIEMFNNDAI